MKPQSEHFKERAYDALKDSQLQKALHNIQRGFVSKRAAAKENLPEFDALREQAVSIKNHTLANLDHYLKIYEDNAKKAGAHIHWAEDAQQACDIILRLCARYRAKNVIKGKSMVSEEINLNHALEAGNIPFIESDLGEYIIQLRDETPSHIIAPAVHLNKEQIAEDFRKKHHDLPSTRKLDHTETLVAEARMVLRQKYLEADIGITGANLLIAETGSSLIVTNEGNGDLTQSLPNVHIVITSIEKIIPTLEDATLILRLLARSATGQEFSAYTTISTGPKRKEDPDGPEYYHVVLVDNGRSDMLGSDFQEMLRCIKCGACLNHCPVYQAVGGHSYGWIYQGPMGAVLTPHFIGLGKGALLPDASTFCGRCQEVCPMNIPLPKMMRHWRERAYEQKLTPKIPRIALSLWAMLAKTPIFYHPIMRLAMSLLWFFGKKRGAFSSLPFASGWTQYRDFPIPQRHGFRHLWKRNGGDDI